MSDAVDDVSGLTNTLCAFMCIAIPGGLEPALHCNRANIYHGHLVQLFVHHFVLAFIHALAHIPANAVRRWGLPGVAVCVVFYVLLCNTVAVFFSALVQIFIIIVLRSVHTAAITCRLG